MVQKIRYIITYLLVLMSIYNSFTSVKTSHKNQNKSGHYWLPPVTTMTALEDFMVNLCSPFSFFLNVRSYLGY